MSPDPAQIGRYRVEAVLGRGAMGVIYRAHDPDIDRPVAIKLIRADLLEGSERADYLVRFRREAQAAGRCTHPNIVAIYDFAVHEGNPFLAMEFVDGVSLSQARERGARFEAADAVFLVLQVLDALAAAHAMGIVHRDIKPANILLLGGTRVKVTDFGISRFDASEMTQDGSVIGTPSYMSPEQCRGDPVDGRSDLFSTGAVLYELLCGERAFAGRNAVEVMGRLLRDEPPELRSGAIPPALQPVVARALAKRAEARFGTASAMAAALRAAMPGHAAESTDRTIVMPHGTGGAGPGEGIDAETLATIERKLARYVGPIARVLVRSAARQSDSVEGLCASLAERIARQDDRDQFRADALRHVRSSPAATGHAQRTTASAMHVSAPEMERAQQALTRFLGPVARILVKRAAASARSSAEFWDRLAQHIDQEQDRKAFRATAPNGLGRG